jgi:hypothetical protein
MSAMDNRVGDGQRDEKDELRRDRDCCRGI